jgi:uncharacterized membrane protein
MSKQVIREKELGSEKSGLKRMVVAGLIILSPFVATYMVVKWFIGIFHGFPGDELFYVTAYPILNDLLKAGALTAASGLLIVVVGKFASTRKGSLFEKKLDVFFMRLPFIGSVYSITKTAMDTVLRKKEDFEHPVKLNYNGMKFTAFQTGRCVEEGKRLVFVPTSPNITSGFVIEVDESQIEETEETLEQAFTRVLSAGFSN